MNDCLRTKLKALNKVTYIYSLAALLNAIIKGKTFENQLLSHILNSNKISPVQYIYMYHYHPISLSINFTYLLVQLLSLTVLLFKLSYPIVLFKAEKLFKALKSYKFILSFILSVYFEMEYFYLCLLQTMLSCTRNLLICPNAQSLTTHNSLVKHIAKTLCFVIFHFYS